MMDIFEQLQQCAENSDDYIFIKTRQLQYVSGNKLMRTAARTDQLRDKTDYDLPWVMFADKYRQDDKRVLQGEIIECVESFLIDDQVKLVTVRKEPIYDNQTIVGVIGFTRLLNNTFNKHHRIYKELKKFNSMAIDTAHLAVGTPKLSTRQIEILWLYMYGYSAREIGAILFISSRTVDSHIEMIKQKYNCHSRSEVVNLAFQYGLHLIIPSTLLNKI